MFRLHSFKQENLQSRFVSQLCSFNISTCLFEPGDIEFQVTRVTAALALKPQGYPLYTKPYVTRWIHTMSIPSIFLKGSLICQSQVKVLH